MQVIWSQCGIEDWLALQVTHPAIADRIETLVESLGTFPDLGQAIEGTRHLRVLKVEGVHTIYYRGVDLCEVHYVRRPKDMPKLQG